MRKTAVSILLLVTITPMVYLFILPLKQQWIRHRMERELEEKADHTIILAENDLHWIRPGRELLVEGRMFDVKEISYLDNSKVKIKGIFDEEETVFTRQLEKDHEENNTGGKKAFCDFFSFQLALPEYNACNRPSSIDLKPCRNSSDDNILPNTARDILTPPPRA